MAQVTKCHLHVPHKLWADSIDEQRNYLAIERWCRDYLRRYSARHSTRSTPLLFPYKEWFDADPLERRNYSAMETWVYLQVPASLGQVKTKFSRYDLFIPHKDWAIRANLPNGDLEQENYLAIERWAFKFLRSCLPVGS